MTRESNYREEDELLQFAYLPTTVKKHYAIRYRGYVQDLPYFFRKVIQRKDRNERDYLEATIVNITDTSSQTCRKGDWIVGLPDGRYQVVDDESFFREYQNLLKMNNAD